VIGHGLLNDHFVLRVDRDLDVVADVNLRIAAIARLSGSVSDICASSFGFPMQALASAGNFGKPATP
jgi:hypothetical protein